VTGATTSFAPRKPELAGQIVVVIGGRAGIGSRPPAAPGLRAHARVVPPERAGSRATGGSMDLR
jgi:hypothetical protein